MGPESSTTQPSDSSEATDSSESDSLGPGDALCGRYRIVDRLGSGGFGQVLSAVDIETDRRVAIKILHADAGARDPAAVARMRQEAEILEAIDHPNIVELYQVGDSEHGEFMVMELLEGDSLDHLLEAEGASDPDRIRPLVKQLLDALEAAHQKQVLHRDIKPENIILIDAPGARGSQEVGDQQAGTERVKLLDFGVAKAQEILDDDPDEGVTLVKTRGGGFVGTPRYCAPEMAVGDPAGPSADLFSLGLVLAEWLTGNPRIDANKQNAVLAFLIQPEPLDVSDCPKSWQPWLSRMIAKDPEQRYASAREALDAFEALVEGRGDDIDLAGTQKQTPLVQAHALGAGDVSETADTLVRDSPAFDHEHDFPDTSSDASPDDQPSGTAMAALRFVLVAAVSCGAVLLLLLLVRSLIS